MYLSDSSKGLKLFIVKCVLQQSLTSMAANGQARCRDEIKPFDAHCCCHMGTAIKHPVPDRVKQSFVIFDIQAL